LRIDNTVRLWDIAGGKEVNRFNAQRAPVASAAFLPDGRSVLFCTDASPETRVLLARVWDLETVMCCRAMKRNFPWAPA